GRADPAGGAAGDAGAARRRHPRGAGAATHHVSHPDPAGAGALRGHGHTHRARGWNGQRRRGDRAHHRRARRPEPPSQGVVSGMRVDSFRLKRPAEIERMRAAGRVLGECLAQLAAGVRPGVTTLDLDREADTFIRDHGCIPGFLGYDGFPNSLCVSVNDEVVHGIPGPRVIREGDLVSLDCGLILDGWWADSGLSVACGEASPEVASLLEVTAEALQR